VTLLQGFGRTVDIQLKYVGTRFDGAKLPLDVLSDLPAFRDLIVAFARQRWRKLNADRERVPRGFDRSLNFALTGIDEGSAVPKLSWDRDSAQALLPGFADELESIVTAAFGEVVGLVADAANGNFPNALPAEHVSALNRFGSGLRDDERIEFLGSAGADGKVVYLDTIRRKALITKVHETYVVRHEGVGKLIGSLAPSDQAVGRITVETQEFGTIHIPVASERAADEFDGHIGQQIQFEIDVELDNQDRFRTVDGLHAASLIDEQVAADLVRCRARMQELAKLENNWDGEGALATDQRARAAALALLGKRPVLASSYKIFPTVEGGILFEFVANGWDLSVEIAAAGTIELFGVEVAGKGEFLPLQFADVGEEFIKKFDERVGRNGR
jgi:hypothetical protein